MSMIYTIGDTTIGDTKYVLMYALRSSKHNPHAHPRKYSCAGFDHPAIGIYITCIDVDSDRILVRY